MRLNGNLVLNSDATGEIDNVYLERLSAAPTFNSMQKGRIYFNTTNSIYYYNDGTTWQPFATGGSASSLQSEVDNLEAAIGPAVNADGTYNVAGINTVTGVVSSPSSITDAINQIASAVNTDDYLSALRDVQLGTLSNGQFLTYNSTSGKWNNHTLVLADVTDVTATAQDVNLLAGTSTATPNALTTSNLLVLAGTTASASDLNSITGFAAQSVTATEFGYLNGGTPVTSSIQAQLNNKQPLNTGLTNWASFVNGAGTGIVVQTGVNSFADRTMVSNNNNLTITNPDGVAGAPTFDFALNIAALSSVTSTGFLTYIGSNAFAERSILTGSSSRIVVTNGDGVAASPTIDLATVSNDNNGSLLKVEIDSYGRVTGSTPILASDIESLVGTYYLATAGGTMTGNIAMGDNFITGLPTPVNSQDAANKAYVDSVASGLSVQPEVFALSNTNLSATYTAGTTGAAGGGTGVGATLTASAAGILTVDGVSPALGDRVLVNGQTTATQNGIYTLTTVGTGTVAWVLTRATDANNSIAEQVGPGNFVWVAEGDTYGSTGWVLTSVGTGANESIVIGTDPIGFNQFSGAGTYTAGSGLTLTGGQFAVDYGAGITSVPSGDVGISLYSTTASALILTQTGTSRDTSGPGSGPAYNAKLALLLPAGAGLVQDATGLYIPTAGVTNSMLANNSLTLDVDSAGTGTVALGGTLAIYGTAAQGISTSISGSTITINVADATTSSKGVASFNSASFTTSSGVVSIASAGISNSMLANPSWGISGTTGGVQQIALGTSLSVVGGSSPITTVSSAGTLTINVASATASTLGLASFNGSQFSTVAGAVSLAMTLGQGGITNVNSTVDSAATGDLLQFNGTKWTNQPVATVLSGATLDDIGNVSDTGVVGGETLVYSTSGSNYQARPIYFLYTAGAAATTHTVSHNLGQKYCVVTVVDESAGNTDEVVIPQSIYFNDANTLTVTFNSAILCNIVVMGVNGS